MTAPDVRTAAQTEAEKRYPSSSLLRVVFADGAAWGAAHVTPTREQIAEVLYEAICEFPSRKLDPKRSWPMQEAEEYADAVLALITKEDHGSN